MGYSTPQFFLGIAMLMLFGGAVAFFGVNSYFVSLVHSHESYTINEQNKLLEVVEDVKSIETFLHKMDKQLDRVENNQKRILKKVEETGLEGTELQ